MTTESGESVLTFVTNVKAAYKLVCSNLNIQPGVCGDSTYDEIHFKVNTFDYNRTFGLAFKHGQAGAEYVVCKDNSGVTC